MRIMFADVEARLKRKNKILFSKDSSSLRKLAKLLTIQNHRTVIMWALDCAQIPLEKFELKYPNETRPRTCLEVSKSWARGKVKMPLARRAILNAHAVAKEIDDSEYGALCHAIGHAGATVHTEGHALGLPMYELTAMVLMYGKDNFTKPVEEKNILLYRSTLVLAKDRSLSRNRMG